MSKNFIEFVDQIIELPEDTTSKEAWLIAYNKKKEDNCHIVNLSKLWSCVNDLECGYSDAHMEQLKKITQPFVNFSKVLSNLK